MGRRIICDFCGDDDSKAESIILNEDGNIAICARCVDISTAAIADWRAKNKQGDEHD